MVTQCKELVRMKPEAQNAGRRGRPRARRGTLGAYADSAPIGQAPTFDTDAFVASRTSL